MVAPDRIRLIDQLTFFGRMTAGHKNMNIKQVDDNGKLLHLATITGLPPAVVQRLFNRATQYLQGERQRLLLGRLVVLVFYESSTRTRCAFDISAKQLGADVVSLDQINMAGDTKKESLEDTIRNVAAMGASGIVLRHGQNNSSAMAIRVAPEGIGIINGGDGCYAHPTQALTDAFTLCQHFGGGDNLVNKKVAIVGDVLHSRVARSNFALLRLLGVEDICLIGPPKLCPPNLAEEFKGTRIYHDIDEGLRGVDVVMLLRVQFERFDKATETYLIDINDLEIADNYHRLYGLTAARLQQLGEHAVVLHPGPINRGMEVTDEVADGGQSLILQQVANGMAIRYAVLSDILAS